MSIPSVGLNSIALSGLRAAGTSLQVAGHNLANLPVKDFHRQQAVARSVPQGGVEVDVRVAERPGHAMEADVVGLMQARHAFAANLAVFRAGDRMTGTLLDALG